MWCDDLCRLGWDSYVPRGQRAIRVAADKLFALMVPGYRVDRLKHTAAHRQTGTRRAPFTAWQCVGD